MGVIKAEFEETKKRLPDGKGIALDIGCGNFPYKKIIKEKGYNYVGIDIVIPKNVGRSNFILADAHNLPIKTKSIDLVFNSHFLEHVENPKKVIKEFERVLINGGYVITLVPFMTPFHSNDFWRFTPLGLKKLFENFEIIEFYTPTHIFTKIGHFLDVFMHRLGFKSIGNWIRNTLSRFDKYFNLKGLEGWAHSYLIICKKK